MKSADLSLLGHLDALLQEGSVTRAARRVGRSTPAMSQILGRLRAQFGDPLLVRAGRSMVLTPRAEAMKPRVNDAVAQARLVMKPSDAPPLREVDREYVVAGSDYVLTVLGAALDAVVRDEAPQLRLRFIPNAAQDAEALRSGAVDLAVGIYGVLPPELRQRPLLTDRFVCVARAGHPYAREPLSLDRYLSAQHIQVAPRGQPGGYIDDVLAERGRARRVRRAVPYFLAALALAAASDDLLTVSERVATTAGAAHGLQVFELPFATKPYALSLVWHPRYDGDATHRFVREAFVRAAEVALAHHRHADAMRRLPRRARRKR